MKIMKNIVKGTNQKREHGKINKQEDLIKQSNKDNI